MFNPNPAFLLLQMLMKPAPKGFTLGVRANVQPKSSIPIAANVDETSPKGLYNRSHQG
jgi:hypothetical protein